MTIDPIDLAARAPTPLTPIGPNDDRSRWVAPSLPRPLTSLIGRDRDRATLTALLADPAVRLVTLVGPGGVGKTRLAIEIARALEPAFRDGVFLVPLAPVNDLNLVATTIARVVGVREQPGQAIPVRLAGALRDRHVLLLLDNFEQVAGAAAMVHDLLVICPEVKALVTSRVLLRVSGERAVAVLPLSVSEKSGVRSEKNASSPHSDAVQLFAERAEAVQTGFTLDGTDAAAVAEICTRLDGLPLAIELAAARSNLLSPRSILERLGGAPDRPPVPAAPALALLTGGPLDQPERLRSLRAALAWSYDLLTPAEQTIFRRLAVFEGGLTLDAAEYVASEQSEVGREENETSSYSPLPTPHSVLDDLASLVDKSLLTRAARAGGEPRFTMLETIRAYGLEQLEVAGEGPATRARHAEFFLDLAQRAEPELTGPRQAAWLERLEADHPNLRAALTWTIQRSETGLGLRLGGALWRFWEVHGHLSEGRSHLTALVAHPDAAAWPAERATVLGGAGWLAARQGDYPRAVAHSDAALAAWRDLGDQRGAARALLCLASVARYQDDFERAHELGEESLALSRASGDAWGTAWALAHLGMVAWVRGDRQPAIAHLEEGLALHRAAGDRQGVCESLIELAKTARQQGEFSRAQALLAESLALHRAVGDRQGICVSLDELGGIAYDQGEHERAATLLSEALTLAQDLGERRLTAYLFAHLGEVAFVTGDVPLASTRFGESLTLFWSMGNKWGIARCLQGFAALATASGQPTRATRLLGAWAALHEAIGAPPVRGGGGDTPAAVQATLGPVAFAAAWAAGRALTLDRAITEALAQDAQPPGGGADAPPGRDAAASAIRGSTPAEPAFTRRELEILRLLAEGRTNPEIAAALSISRKTVANHVSGILAKLQVETRSAAAAQAIRLHLV